MRPLEILLIEDEPGDILLMKQALAREPVPISIHVAVDGREAMQMLSEGRLTPNLIILDLNLPKLSGLGFLQGYRPDVPIVVFTSSSNQLDRHKALALGADECVQKPLDLTEYQRLVSQMVRNWAMAPAA